MEIKYEVRWNKVPNKQLDALYNYIAFEKKEPISAYNIYVGVLEFSKSFGTFPQAAEVYRTIGKTIYRSQTYKGSLRLIYRIDEKKKQVIITELFHNSQSPLKKSRLLKEPGTITTINIDRKLFGNIRFRTCLPF